MAKPAIMDRNVILNSIALMHINKRGGQMLADFETALKNSGENKTVEQLLEMSVSEFIQTNANEAMHTGNTGYGAEFVESVVLSRELIDRMTDEESLMSHVVIHRMNGKTVDVPVKGARTRMTGQSESTTYPGTSPAVPTSQVKKAGTAKITLVAKLLRITVYISDELVEDSVIGIAEYVMSELVAAYERSMHEIIINGDTDTGANTNINIIDGNTSALPDGANTDLLQADGLRKYAIDNSLTVNAGTNLALSNIRSARALMGIKGLNPKNLRLVVDQSSYFKLLNLSQAETIEKFGDAATVKDGVIAAIDGIKVIPREELLKAQADGTQSATGSNNTLGSMVLYHVPSAHVGIRRDFTTEESRWAENGETGITGSTRIAFEIDDTQNTTQASKPVALIRNI